MNDENDVYSGTVIVLKPYGKNKYVVAYGTESPSTSDESYTVQLLAMGAIEMMIRDPQYLIDVGESVMNDVKKKGKGNIIDINEYLKKKLH